MLLTGKRMALRRRSLRCHVVFWIIDVISTTSESSSSSLPSCRTSHTDSTIPPCLPNSCITRIRRGSRMWMGRRRSTVVIILCRSATTRTPQLIIGDRIPLRLLVTVD